MGLQLIDKAHIRRHLKFSMIGKPFQGDLGNSIYGMRSSPVVQDLEIRMGTMSPDEEAILLGKAYGAIAVQLVSPGAVLTATITGGSLVSPVVVPVTALSTDDAQIFCARIAAAFAADATLVSAGFIALAPWGAGALTDNTVLYPEMAVVNAVDFTLTISVTGTISAYVSSNGSRQDPSVLVVKRPATLIYGYLPLCNYFEGAIGGATRNLEISKAETAVFRGDEIEQRQGLYAYWCQRLAEFMGLQVNNPSSDYGACCI